LLSIHPKAVTYMIKPTPTYILAGPLSGIKFMLMLLPVMLFAHADVLAQWETQSPSPTFLDIRGVAAPTGDRIFISTNDSPSDEGGALFESADGGITWQQRDVPENLNTSLNGIFFLNDQLGWVFGNLNYRTTDGGSSWTEIPSLGSAYFMEFYTPDFGLATGNFGAQVSFDGGESWEASPEDIRQFTVSTAGILLGSSATGIYRSTDGGVNFTQVYGEEATAVVYMTESVAVAIAGDTLLRSSDGGQSWTEATAALGRTKLHKVSENTVLAWGSSGEPGNFDDRLLRSGDGGQSWQDVGTPAPEGVHSINASSGQDVTLAALSGDMYYSADAGASWTKSYNSGGDQPSFFNSGKPVFPTAETGYFGYGAGLVIKTTDAGASWNQVSSGTGQGLNAIDRFPDGDLIVVGDGGSILKSDGQSPWIPQENITLQNMEAIDVVGTEEVVAADQNGQLYISTDAGESWQASGTPAAGLDDARDIHFSSLQEGWITGEGDMDATLHRTVDGGSSWTPVPGFGGSYPAVDQKGDFVWVAAIPGRYYRSTDGGSSWEQGQLPGGSLIITEMEFYDESNGYAIGWFGYVARSSNGGESWQVMEMPDTDERFIDMHLLGPDELWLSTSGNRAYYSNTGGQSWAILEIESPGNGYFSGIYANSSNEAWVVGNQGYLHYFNDTPPPPENLLPEASFTYLADGLTVNFTDTSTDTDGSIVSWSWDFGDGNSSDAQNPSHTFTESDTYIVELTVTDDDGATDSGVAFIPVQPNPGGTFGDFTEITPLDDVFITPANEDFWVVSMAPADFDGDGLLDIAVLGYYVVYNESVEYRLTLMKNNGPDADEENQWDFSYIDVPLEGLNTGASDLAWGDYNGDGAPDLVVASELETRLLRNENGTLVPTAIELPGYLEDNSQAEFDLDSVSWADYDNDGDLDLLIPSVYDQEAFEYRTALMRNDGPDANGDYIFTDVDAGFAPTRHAQSIWADYDNDGDLDLLLANIAPNADVSFIHRYTNNGDGSFTQENLLGDLVVQRGMLQWGDANADGFMDILVAGNVQESDGSFAEVLRIYEGDAEGNYSTSEPIECLSCEGWLDITAATWADYDSNGSIDLLLAGSYNSGSQIEGRAKIFINEGGNFVDDGNDLPAPRASGDRGGTFSWLDLDNEGDLDYFIAGQYFVPGGNGLIEAQMHVYRNDTPGQNNAPNRPANTDAITTGPESVHFSWDSATDDSTPQSALTYELEVYRDGQAIPETRRLQQPGKLRGVGEWELSGLPEGSYQWTIRAVDASYTGSPAATGSFTLGTTSSNAADEIPQRFALEQNYPNPFNPATTIEYALPEAADVRLEVFNMMGQRVATLVDARQNAGQHTTSFNAANLASGMYIYRITAGSFTASQKMMLLK
jgi:photosystem II stability/assembly factor-like uncharacterized protein